MQDRHGAVRLDNFTLEIRPGEIVGLAGVEGNGQSELGMVLAGLLRPTEGRFYIGGSELTHAGAGAETRESRWAPVAPSQLASDYRPILVPKAMERADIRRVQADWVWAAKQARSAGFDIVYVYGGHSYLLTQFLSPFYNRRSDEYGGPF